ncbi:MAG: hypothetical protein M3Z25_11265 [Actinomycetota bacterium]|nr:hypothetical protein [Actinomycetota bacterium]
MVVNLGADGTVQPRDLDALLAAAGRRVVLVGVSVPRRWRSGNNDLLRATAAGHAPVVVSSTGPRWSPATPVASVQTMCTRAGWAAHCSPTRSPQPSDPDRTQVGSPTYGSSSNPSTWAGRTAPKCR